MILTLGIIFASWLAIGILVGLVWGAIVIIGDPGDVK